MSTKKNEQRRLDSFGVEYRRDGPCNHRHTHFIQERKSPTVLYDGEFNLEPLWFKASTTMDSSVTLYYLWYYTPRCL